MPAERFEDIAASVATVIVVPGRGRTACVRREPCASVPDAPATGVEVIGCVVDGVVALRLGAEISGPAWTVAQLLARARAGRLAAGDRTLLLVDEAHKVGLGDWLELARLSERYGLRVLAVACAEQLESVELPSTFGPFLTIHKDLA